MPKLLTFGVCRQAIMDRENNSVSIISLLNAVTVIKPIDQEIPSDANSPVEWSIATAWVRQDGDLGKTFDQRHLLVSPDGGISEAGNLTLTFGSDVDSRIMTSIVRATGFPVGQPGILNVRVELKEETEEVWETVADYPVEVRHTTQEELPVVAN